ncbi:MAG: bifunctional lysylphosphatidylglycerol flippase/synthetase MprF [Thermoanaerobaculia bacterium]|nr:bifunctional lysylphosphatidylglycerol flippase/synthetase MprF [Thermoanaerobaculia bacterium]
MREIREPPTSDSHPKVVPTPSRLGTWRRVAPFVSLAIFAVALAILHRELQEIHYLDVVDYLGGLPLDRLLLACLFTVAGYTMLSGYDWIGFQSVGDVPPLHRVLATSFIGYSFSNTMGYALLTSTPLRFRLYTGWGVSAEAVTRVVALGFVTFWVGLASLAGGVFTFFPGTLPRSLHLPFSNERGLGLALLALAISYLTLCAVRRQPLRVGSWEMVLPAPSLALTQVVVGSLDWSFSAAVLYVLLPSEAGLGFLVFLPVFLLAQMGGFLSQVPGGLGVFETVMVLTLSPWLVSGPVLGALIAYRLVYYLAPFFLSVTLLVLFELSRHRRTLDQARQRVGEWMGAVMPQALALAVFVSGAMLLFSSATPTPSHRLLWVGKLFPLQVVEASHFLVSLSGMGLILLARGLQRRLGAAYHLTLWLLAAGSALSLSKGLDWGLAAISSLLLVSLWANRRWFYRKASLTDAPFSAGWIAAIALVMGTAAWLTLFAFRHVDYSGELWWRFALDGEAPRSLRALVGTAVLVLGISAARLLRPAVPEPDPPDAAELDRAARIAASSPRASAWLALLGDKRLLFDEAGTAFLMFSVEGRSWVAMGDPVGPTAAGDELAWRFRELAEQHGGWPVFYQVSDEDLPRYVDMGLSLLKLGEEGRVPLEGFTLEGSARKDLRQAQRKAEKEGCSFEVLEPAVVPSLIEHLRHVSDAWLADKGAEEKGFSLGFFDPAYLARTPLAVVRRDGEIVAFANLWPGSRENQEAPTARTTTGELSIDLMRYGPDAPRGVMTYLFTELMLWGAGQGYRWFSMGMAPLSGLDQRQGVPLWNRVGGLVYRHGEHFYNFQGLRQYKEKFDPQWEGRYLAAPGGLALPQILANVTTLISGGVRGVFSR